MLVSMEKTFKIFIGFTYSIILRNTTCFLILISIVYNHFTIDGMEVYIRLCIWETYIRCHPKKIVAKGMDKYNSGALIETSSNLRFQLDLVWRLVSSTSDLPLTIWFLVLELQLKIITIRILTLMCWQRSYILAKIFSPPRIESVLPPVVRI